jgi:hypothetical protein
MSIKNARQGRGEGSGGNPTAAPTQEGRRAGCPERIFASFWQKEDFRRNPFLYLSIRILYAVFFSRGKR